MIDLRGIDPLDPAHFDFDSRNSRLDFSCTEMESVPANAYQCIALACGLVYNKFIFTGYYKNPDLPYPHVAYPENILDKAMVCKPRCAILKSSARPGFYACTVCGGSFMKHPECGILAVSADWLMQDPRVLKFLIKEAQKETAFLRKELAGHPDSEAKAQLVQRLEATEKIFFVEILSRCRL